MHEPTAYILYHAVEEDHFRNAKWEIINTVLYIRPSTPQCSIFPYFFLLLLLRWQWVGSYRVHVWLALFVVYEIWIMVRLLLLQCYFFSVWYFLCDVCCMFGQWKGTNLLGEEKIMQRKIVVWCWDYGEKYTKPTGEAQKRILTSTTSSQL